MSVSPFQRLKTPTGFALLLLGGLACLLFRPHGDTFTALDHSGYRMMSYAFSQGRGLHEQDRMLMEVPEEIRNAFLLFPHMNYRNTRDRSFLIKNLQQGDTEPFFYPLVPGMASGLNSILPGGRDFLMPIFGLLFCGGLLGMGWRCGRSAGLGLGFVFCLASPLPLWLFRGFYVEAAGASLLVLSVTSWFYNRSSLFTSVLLGCLASALHPVYLLIALPLACVMMLSRPRGAKAFGSTLAGILLGILPLLGMTLWVCAPYGTLNLSHLLLNLRYSIPHQLMFCGMVISFGLLMLFAFSGRVRRLLVKAAASSPRRAITSVLAMLPLFAALSVWGEKSAVQGGLHEFWLALRWPFGFLLVAGVILIHWKTASRKAFSLWLLFLLTLPVFLYLKGTEQVGMWSQRRLMPAYTLMSLALLPVLAQSLFRTWPSGKNKSWRVLIVSGLLICAFANFVRWPAPYLVRVEKGALAELETVKASLAGRLSFFDYQPYSFPFAVDNRTRALGFNPEAMEQLDQVISWLGEKAQQEDLLFVAGYSNPGLEHRLSLRMENVFEFDVDRIQAKAALPARKRVSEIRLDVLKAEWLTEQDGDLVLDKIMDGGPLALRPPWLDKKSKVTATDGERLPVVWSRQGSGVVGPVLPKGEVLQLSLWAKSGQLVPQEMWVLPPWGGSPVRFQVPAVFGEVRVQVPVTAETSDPTGIYRFRSPTPYNPATRGIQGYPEDLGILIHRIRIEAVPVVE